jgi:hypothetical protein
MSPAAQTASTAAPGAEQCAYFFFHIPKTAGSSMRTVLRSWIPHAIRDHAASAPVDLDAGPRPLLIDAHFSARLRGPPAALLERYPAIARRADLQVITFVREPLEHAISYYYHQRDRGQCADVTLRAFLQGGHDNQLSAIFPYARGYGGLLTDFFFCGVAERADESIRLLARLLGRNSVPAPRVNLGARDAQAFALDDRVRAAFRERFAADYAIYELAQRGLDEKRAALDAGQTPALVAEKFRHFTDPAQRTRDLVRVSDQAIVTTHVPGVARIHRATIVDASRAPRHDFTVDETIGIQIEYEILDSLAGAQPTIRLANEADEVAFVAAFTDPVHGGRGLPAGRYRSLAWVPPHLLNPGTFLVSVNIACPSPVECYATARGAAAFSVREAADDRTSARGLWRTPFPGSVRPRLAWETARAM